MSSRSICRNSTRKVPGKGGQGIVQCAGQAGGSCSAPINPRISTFVAQQQQQLQLQFAQRREREDYRIYPQSVDLNAFFGEEQKCEKVSDVCLLNDHFILVKMPEQQKQEQQQQEQQEQQVASKRNNFGSKLPRCFKCNRGSRVSPILEEVEESRTVTVASSPWTSSEDDDADVEVFVSSTRIISPQHNRQQQLQAVLTVPVKPQPVIVEQPQPDNSMQLQLDALQPAPVADPPAQAAGSSFGAWHWFLWPFRRRLSGKPKAQLAAVHKTYFVRWNKPPDTLWHGYGVERDTNRQPQVGLRRCRSAIF